MKRAVAAVALAVLALPALAAELPYDQNLVDRALPNIPERAVPGDAYQGTTFEQYAPA
ncbi:MAG TPA: hypothetical protein VFZ84_02215 [Burkholderiales bacterium]